MVAFVGVANAVSSIVWFFSSAIVSLASSSVDFKRFVLFLDSSATSRLACALAPISASYAYSEFLQAGLRRLQLLHYAFEVLYCFPEPRGLLFVPQLFTRLLRHPLQRLIPLKQVRIRSSSPVQLLLKCSSPTCGVCRSVFSSGSHQWSCCRECVRSFSQSLQSWCSRRVTRCCLTLVKCSDCWRAAACALISLTSVNETGGGVTRTA